jgi:hypothetical protein
MILYAIMIVLGSILAGAAIYAYARVHAYTLALRGRARDRFFDAAEEMLRNDDVPAEMIDWIERHAATLNKWQAFMVVSATARAAFKDETDTKPILIHPMPTHLRLLWSRMVMYWLITVSTKSILTGIPVRDALMRFFMDDQFEGAAELDARVNDRLLHGTA